MAKAHAATIANGASLSDAINLGDDIPVGLQMPAAWTAAVVTFAASYNGSTYVSVRKNDGTEYTATVAVDQQVALDPAIMAACQFLKVRSGTAASAVNQGAARVIQVLTVEG